MAKDIFEKVADWHCNGLPEQGLSGQEREEIVQSAQGSYLAEHVDRTDAELEALTDESLVAVHYSAMVDASR
jgi:hypothetical protein